MKVHQLTFIVFLLAVSLSETCYSSDEYAAPNLVENSSFESYPLDYKVVGLEKYNEVRSIWVVVSNIKTKKNNDLIKIIRDLNLRYPSKYEYVKFYTRYSLRDNSAYFRITDEYCIYIKSDNRIYFGTASGKLYGGWLEIPK